MSQRGKAVARIDGAYIQMGPRNGANLRGQEGRREWASQQGRRESQQRDGKPGGGRKRTREGIACGQSLQMVHP